MEERELFLLDASLVVAAYVEGHRGALGIMKATTPPYILDLTLAEVANTLINKKLPLHTIQDLNSVLSEAPFGYIQTDYQDVQNAINIAHKYDTTVYDSLYHATAIRRQMTFATLDKQYYQKTSSLGNIFLVKHS